MILVNGVSLLETVSDKTMGCVIGRYAHFYAISLNHFNPVFFHPAREDPAHNNIIVALYLHGPSAHDSGYHAFQFD